MKRDPIARERALEAISLARTNGPSLTAAARAAHTTLPTIRRYAGQALKQLPSGRLAVTPSDRLTRRVWVLSESGRVDASVRGSRQAARVAQYMTAVDHYLRTGDAARLAGFEGKGVRSRGQFHLFLTDTEILERLANAGQVSFERLYVLRA